MWRYNEITREFEISTDSIESRSFHLPGRPFPGSATICPEIPKASRIRNRAQRIGGNRSSISDRPILVLSPKSGRFRPSWSSRRSACRHCLATLPITSNGTLEAGFRFALAADPTTCHRAPCRLDKHERITKLAICDSSARPPGAHRQARCAHAAHNFALSFACIAGTYGWPESMTMVRLQKSRAAANAASRGTP